MNHLKFATLLLVTAMSGTCAAADPIAGQRDSLQVTRTEAGYQLVVPISHLVLTIADAKLEQKSASGGSMSNPRYFSFSDDRRGLIVSGWFEPADLFKGLQKFWASETESWRKQSLPEPTNVEAFSLDGWQIVCYDMKIPGESNTHVRAHWVQAGTWIDLHISLTGKPLDGISREAILEFLKKITIVERSDSK